VSMYGTGGGNIKKPIATIEIADPMEAEGMEIGKTVAITLSGTVKSIHSPRDGIDYNPGGSKTKKMPGSIEIEISKIGLKTAPKDVKSTEY